MFCFSLFRILGILRIIIALKVNNCKYYGVPLYILLLIYGLEPSSSSQTFTPTPLSLASKLLLLTILTPLCFVNIPLLFSAKSVYW